MKGWKGRGGWGEGVGGEQRKRGEGGERKGGGDIFRAVVLSTIDTNEKRFSLVSLTFDL